MAAPAGPGFSRSFSFDGRILTADSSATVEVGLTSDADVIQAIATDAPFPTRPNGIIEFGRISVSAEAGKQVKFNAGNGTVSFGLTGGARTGIGVFDDPADALKSLQLEETPGLRIALDDNAATRFVCVQFGYEIAGSVAGAHPIGALGTATFGVSGQREALYAVLHRIAATDGARRAIADTVSSWRLPRHVGAPGDLKPATWVVAEAEGSLAVKIAAQLGYDFNFIREAKLAGLTGDIGLKLDANVKATFGFEVSGRYLVAIGRESDADERVRLQLFKMSRRGISFGLNLIVGVQGKADVLPGKVDDFTEAVFGVHGTQVIKALQALDGWTDPSKDVSDLVAGLVNDKAIELLRETTGIDPGTAFGEARNALLRILKRWDELPDTLSASLWKILARSDVPALQSLQGTLTILASDDPEKQRAELEKLLAQVDFGERAEGTWLAAAAQGALLAFTEDLDRVRGLAARTLAALDGGILERLQSFLEERLNLDAIRNVITQTDFNRLDSLLVSRLSLFLDEQLSFERIDEIKDSINLVLRKRQEIYEKARTALTRRYEVEFAASFQKTTTKTALLDVMFDLAQPSAQALLAEVVKDSKFDRLLVEPTAGVTLNQAVLTHDISRQGTVQVNLPMFSFRRDHINRSLARVSAEDDGTGRVLAFELDASDEVTVRNRFRSRSAVALNVALAAKSNVRIHSKDKMTWSYQLLHAKANMRREELMHFTRPFIDEHFASQFGGATDVSTWYTDFDRTVEEAVHNGPNEFGDVLTSLEVSVPGRALSAWVIGRTEEQRKSAAMEMSRAIQRALKKLVPFYFFQDVRNLRQNSAAASLMVWAAIPATTAVSFSNGAITLNRDTDVYWNFPDDELRRAMARNSLTIANLASTLPGARARLLEAGDTKNADFFIPSEVQDFVNAAADAVQYESLCFFESQIVRKAAEALKDISDFAGTASTKPSEAIERLAEFGSDITQAFNEKISSIYGKASLRSLGPLVFLEASRSLDPELRTVRPTAMLSLTVLKEERTFALGDFIDGKMPDRDQVAVAQRLVSV